MSNLIKFPSIERNHFTVQEGRGGWFDVVLFTQGPGKTLKTTVAQFPDRESAIVAGKRAAARQMCPFKLRGGAL